MRAIGYSFDFHDAHAAGRALAQVAQDGLAIGVPFPFSINVESLHAWFAATPLAGIKIDIRTVPPPLMAETEPHLLGRLMRAVWKADRWLALPESRTTASELLARPQYLDVSSEIVERALSGHLTISGQGELREVPTFSAFRGGAATFPWRSQAKWIGAQLAARSGLDKASAHVASGAVFRSDLYRLHLKSAGADLPGASQKLEGAIGEPLAVASEGGDVGEGCFL